MNLLFTNLGMLPFLALVAGPLLIHLFARTKPRIYPFSSVALLSAIQRKTSRLQRPQAWLLLLLRTLLVLCVVGMVLKPMLISGSLASSGTLPRTVILLVDQSASMAAQDGARTRFGSAISRATEILSTISGGDKANLIWVRRTPKSVLDAPTENVPALRDASRQAEATMESANWAAAIGEALSQVGDDPNRVTEIYFISDFQKTNWEGIRIEPKERTKFVFVPCSRDLLNNQALNRITLSPTQSIAGEEVEVLCEAVNDSPEPVSRNTFLRVGETVDSKELKLPPKGRGGVSYLVQNSMPGEAIVRVKLDDDPFPYDNTIYAIIDVADKLEIAVLGSDAESRATFARALGVVDQFKVVDRISEQTTVCVLAGWDGQEYRPEIDKLRKRGGALIVLPYEGDLGNLLLTNAPVRREKLTKPLELQISNSEDPALRLFAGGAHGNPAGGRIQERFALPPLGELNPIFIFSDGQSALAIQRNAAPLAIWNIPLSGSNRFWAERPEFVPFLAELVLSMRSGESGDGSNSVYAGDRLSLQLDRDVLEEDIELVCEGRQFPIERNESQTYTFQSVEGLPPGSYEWKIQGTTFRQGVVNFPPIETNLLNTATPEEIMPGSTQVKNDQLVSELREGFPLWPYLLAAALLFALMEGLVCLGIRPTTA